MTSLFSRMPSFRRSKHQAHPVPATVTEMNQESSSSTATNTRRLCRSLSYTSTVSNTIIPVDKWGDEEVFPPSKGKMRVISNIETNSTTTRGRSNSLTTAPYPSSCKDPRSPSSLLLSSFRSKGTPPPPPPPSPPIKSKHRLRVISDSNDDGRPVGVSDRGEDELNTSFDRICSMKYLRVIECK